MRCLGFSGDKDESRESHLKTTKPQNMRGGEAQGRDVDIQSLGRTKRKTLSVVVHVMTHLAIYKRIPS